MRLLLASALVLLALAAPVHADEFNAGTETTAAGALSATLSWQAGDFGPQNARLTVTRAGGIAFDQTIPKACGNECSRIVGDTDDFQFVNLDGIGEPELYINSFNLDHCCETMGVYALDTATGGYTEFTMDWRSPLSVQDVDDDGISEIVTRDGRLGRALLGGTLPRHVLRYGNRGVTDVTRDFPALIRQDAREALTTVHHLDRRDLEAPAALGTYAADQYLLGKGAAGLELIDRHLARGVIGTPKQSKAYRRKLLALLQRYGYR
jgi:hypothetical protein